MVEKRRRNFPNCGVRLPFVNVESGVGLALGKNPSVSNLRLLRAVKSETELFSVKIDGGIPSVLTILWWPVQFWHVVVPSP